MLTPHPCDLTAAIAEARLPSCCHYQVERAGVFIRSVSPHICGCAGCICIAADAWHSLNWSKTWRQ